MHKRSKIMFLSVWLIVAFSMAALAAEMTAVTKANYGLAARFSPAKLRKLSFDTAITPRLLKTGSRFWYIYETTKGKNFVIVDPVKRTKRPIFDNDKMAALLTLATKNPYDGQNLPITTLKFIKNDTAVMFEVEVDDPEALMKKDEKEKEKEKEQQKEEEVDPDAPKPGKKILTFEYELATSKLTLLTEYKKPTKRPDWASISPDGNTIVFGRKHNLWMMDKANYEKWLKDKKAKDIQDVQLTTDGEENYSYVREERGRTNVDIEKEKQKDPDKRKPASIVWSRDSKSFAMTRSDERKVKDLWVINNSADPRPTLETYKYPMPGDTEMPQTEILVFDVAKKSKVKMKADLWKDQYITLSTARQKEIIYEDEYRPSLWLSETSDKLYFIRMSRDMRKVDVCLANPESGDVTVLIEERLNTYIEMRPVELLPGGQEIVWWSERDGWAHFYLFGADGKLKNQITSGPFHCERLEGVDEKNRILYFTACGKEEGEDPYFMRLYKVSLAGGTPFLLNKGNFDHAVRLTADNLFFVNNLSRVDTMPKSVLMDTMGNSLMELETADLSLLLEAGFKYPEAFKVKADDSKTDLYGVMYKPFDFDPNKKYPIVLYVYPGPQTESVTKNFSGRADTISLAQFGFIVITIGNRGGHPSRSKWYHNFGYGNLRDYGLADKKTCIEQLAARFPWIDIDKVGIYGHSGGGFMSTAAMLVYPDFFKVAVSSSGNHDNNVYNNTWSEKHHGIQEIVDKDGKVTFKYDIAKNSEIAKNLKGHLLITTGDIDNNVHPAGTVRLANALIKAGKRFDFFLFPGQRHGYGDMNDYWYWLRADYFCKHLIGDFSQTVDMLELTRDREQTGDKKK